MKRYADFLILLTNIDLIQLIFQRNATKLCDMKNCDNYSKPFKIILKQIETGPHSGKINEDRRVKELFMKLQDYIADESSTTETEIRRFNEMQLKLLVCI